MSDEQVKQVEDVKVNVDTGKEIAEGTKAQVEEMKQVGCAPVAGGIVWKIMYLTVFVFSVAWFVYCIIGIVPTLMEKVTFVENTYELDIDYPDMYLCLPSFFVKEFYQAGYEGTETGYGHGSFAVDTGSGDNRYSFCDVGFAKGKSVAAAFALPMSGCVSAPAGVSHLEMVDGVYFPKVDGDTATCGGTCKKAFDGTSTTRGNGLSTSNLNKLTQYGTNGEPEGKTYDYPADKKPTSPFKVSTVAQNLAGLLAKTDMSDDADFTKLLKDKSLMDADGKMKDGGRNVFEPYCFEYRMNAGTSANFKEEGMVAMLQMVKTSEFIFGAPPFYEAYFVPQGETPYFTFENGTMVVNVTSQHIPGQGQLNVVSLTKSVISDQTDLVTQGAKQVRYSAVVSPSPIDIEYSKDIARGTYTDGDGNKQNLIVDTKYCTNWNAAGTCDTYSGTIGMDFYNAPAKDEGYRHDAMYMSVAMRFGTFRVSQVTVRFKTNPERFAEISAIWTGCIMFLTFLFSQSGYLNKDGKPVKIFNFLPKGMRKNYVKDYKKDTTPIEAMQEQIDALKKQVAAMSSSTV